MPGFDEAVARSLDSVMVYADDRTSAVLAAHAIARLRGDNVTWLDIRDPGGPPEPYDELLRAVVGPRRAYRTAPPDDLAPENAAANLALWTVIRSDEPTEVVAQFVDFLRLPTSVQKMFEQFGPADTSPTLVVTNSDRIAALYPEDVESTKGFVDVFARQGIKLVATIVGIERKDRFAYQHVYRLRSPPGSRWEEATWAVETPTPTGGSALGPTHRLGDAPGIRELLR